MFLRHKRGQSTLEYALLIAAVVAGLVMMQVYLKRGVGGRLKSGADDIGEQFDPAAFSSQYNIVTGTARRETVADKVTRSQLTAPESTSRSGSETVSGWAANENLYREH